MATITDTNNRIDQLFSKKKKQILSVYFTAGYPQLEDTLPILESLQDSGVDLVELGMPFSDPIADGPTIQDSSTQALANGMSIVKLFKQLENFREKIHIPVVLMGYLNPVMQFGLEAFCEACQRVGIDGLIIPDLPIDEYQEKYKSLFRKHGLFNIFLISPQTSEERIRKIDEHSQGFIYMVSAPGITGARQDISEEQKDYFRRVKDMNLKHPRVIGFGISNRETFEEACQHAQGAIIGSAFIKALQKKEGDSEDVKAKTKAFISSIIST